MSGIPRILVNGCERDSIPAGDRGLAYGDGLFETMAVKTGHPLHWERHMARLCRGADRLGIPVPIETLESETRNLCSGVGKGVLKLVLTRGAGGRGYRPPGDIEPTRILSLHPRPDYPETWYAEGVDIRICKTRLGLNPALAGFKHLNRLEQVLARAEWGTEFQEGLMLDTRGLVIEGTMSNLFLLRGDTLITPDISRCGVAGIARERLLEIAPRLGLEVQVRDVDADWLAAADALALTNSIIGLWPVRQLEGKIFRIPTMVRELMEAMRREPGE